MLKDMLPHQFRKKVYEGGIENSQVFKNNYKKFYRDPVSPVFYTKIVDELSEANGRKAGIYNQTKGVLVNFRGEATLERCLEFQNELKELASKYDEIIQMATSNFVNLAVPEHIRTKRIIKGILKNNDVPAKRLYRRKRREQLALLRYDKSINPNVRKMLKEADSTLMGEYYKNSENMEMVVLTDNTKLSKNSQAKELPVDLFWHLHKLELLEILDDREVYKKFYFREEFIKNCQKYIRVVKTKNNKEK